VVSNLDLDILRGHRLDGVDDDALMYWESRQDAIMAALERVDRESQLGADLIAAERRRQVEEEGWTPEHDDGHDRGEMIAAARCYAHAAEVAERHDLAEWFGRDSQGRVKVPASINGRWPWGPDAWKPSPDPLRNLAMAGALIAAEIDRLLRTAQVPTAAEDRTE